MMIENPSRIRDVVQGNILAFFMSDVLKSLGETIAAGHREGESPQPGRHGRTD